MTTDATTTTRPVVLERFRRLAAQWREQSQFLSNSAQVAMLKSYQQIIGIGEPAVPLLLKELRRVPDQWFWALEAITSQDPVPPPIEGNSTGWPRRGSPGASSRGTSRFECWPGLVLGSAAGESC